MITGEQVRLADSYGERMKAIQGLKEQLAAEVAERERGLETWTRHLAQREGAIRVAEGEARNAGIALRAIRAEVPLPITRAVEQAGGELRAHVEELRFRRSEHDAAAQQLQRARRETDPPRPKVELEALAEQAAAVAAAKTAAEKREGELKEALARAEAAYDAEVARIRKAALAAEKVAKAAAK